MVSCGSSVPVSEAIVDASAGDAVGVGTAIARGNPAGAGAIGVSDGLGDGALAALAGFSDSDSPSRLGEAFAFALAFLIGVAPFFPTDFFFDFGLGLALGDFVDFAEVTSGVSLGFGFGVSSSSDGLCFFDLGLAVGVGEGLFCVLGLCLAAFGFGLGDSLSERDESLRASCWVFKNSSRLRFSSSLTCARSSVARSALSATTVPNHRRKRTTAAERNRGDRAFKLAAEPMPAVWH